MGSSELVQKSFAALSKCMLPKDTFKGKVAFITGGGTGIGRAITERLSEMGASCCIVSRKLDVLDQTAREIREKDPEAKILTAAADVRNPEAVSSAVDKCVGDLGLPHIVINNAAGNFISPTERLSSNAFRSVVDIVLMGTINVTMDIGKRLIDAKQGANFLGITTVYAHYGSGYVVPSACAKSGVQTLHRSLASEWGKYGFRFNCIAPGPIYTKGAFSRLDPGGQFSKEMVKRIPTKRLGELDEISNLAAYLVSDYSSWLTGEVINFDGGELMSMVGEFNSLERVPTEQWDQLASMIKNVKGS
ncbi:2,4-dienoyl-CoA reductase [(3E)-enoyl-CoA-producing], mitochondrial-like [Symsagittifera roscoffensis]|uniref:2,4-dienoyl-CoA reductase [(3E)-enoyl-CoA-producing], mitochondrial-like n=1 Tax=Symsagittifera roscoffensis TaxID=84072 RepID=UPI00307C0807